MSIARLVGANKEYINKQIPHLSSLLSDSLDEVMEQSEVIVVGNGSPEFAEALKKTRPDQIVIDLFRLKVDREGQIPAGVHRHLLVGRGEVGPLQRLQAQRLSPRNRLRSLVPES